MLKRILFINVIIAITLISISAIDNPVGIIKWSINRKLTIEDFVQVDKLPNSYAATSTTGIFMELTHGDTISTKIYAYFDREKSYWCKTLSKQRGHILKHEQGHFDISHYIANQLKTNLRSCRQEFEYWKVYDNYMIKLDSMQKLYDAETNYSQDSIKQNYWNKYIEGLIRR